MGGMRSKRKGKTGEREAAAKLNELFNCSACRGVQFHGGEDSPDIRCDIPGLHFEVKRSEKLVLWAALEQAIADAGEKKPVVLHRPNKRQWVAVMLLDDLPEIAVQLYLTLQAGK